MSIEIYDNGNGKAIIGGHGETLEVNHSVDILTKSDFLYKTMGYHIQDAFPYLTEDEREFILTSMTAEEWDKIFGDEEE